ncbi:cytochrome P450 [Sporodiniella umbellata]|nr:cytochrome P450 [Sporodiniella umbellata]
MLDNESFKNYLSYSVPLGFFFVSLTYAFVSSHRKENTANGLKEIPYPTSISLPIFGRMFALGFSSPITQMAKWHKEIGPIYKLNMGKKLWVFIGDPHLAHKVFVTHGYATSSRPYHYFLTEVYAKNYRGVVFGQYTDSWKQNRKFLSNLLKPASVDQYNEAGLSEIKILMDRFSEMAKKEEDFIFLPELQLYTTNTTATIMLAQRFKSFTDPGIVRIYDTFKNFASCSSITNDLGTYLPSLSWIDHLTGVKQKLKKVGEDVDKTRTWLIDEALKSKKPSMVKELTNLQKDNQISGVDVQVIITDFLAAGTETSVDTFHWSLAIISQCPEIQAKLISELDRWKAKNPTRDVPNFLQDREDFPYSICVQKEVLRFRPPAPIGVTHTCDEDLVVDGYFIPKGTTLVSCILAMNFDPKIFKDPEVFWPERFLNNTEKMSAAANAGVENRDHFSFGWGRRMCPGIYFAEMQVFNFFVNFFSKFTITAEKSLENSDPLAYQEVGFVIKPTVKKFHIKLREQ